MVQSVQVADRIREEIASGTIAFGERLRIVDLAKRYGVSAMPVREAFRQLSGEGFLVLDPNRTARVRIVDERYLRKLFDMTMAIEVVLARAAAAVWRRADTAELLGLHERYAGAVDAGDAEQVLSINREFHRSIYRRADNPDAYLAIDRHWLFMAALWKRYGYAEERFSGVLSDHWHIVKALDQNDALGAGTLVGAHVIKAAQQLTDMVREARRTAPGAAKPVQSGMLA